MTRNLEKYLHKQMDKEAGLEHTFHRTKIVATVGPACDTYDKLLELVKAGVNVFRLNFSHGAHDDKKQIIEYIQDKRTRTLQHLHPRRPPGSQAQGWRDRKRNDRNKHR